MHYDLPPWSVSILPDCRNVVFNTVKIKPDVETQGDFVRFLIKEIEKATFTNIQDVVVFVKWLHD